MSSLPTVTRFNPTTNGALHIGHLYMVLVNEYEAHKDTGGKFVVRFDDNQSYWRDKIGLVKTKEIELSMINDLAWMGIEVDDYISQLDIEDQTTSEIEMHMRTRGPILRGKYFHEQIPITRDPFVYYPYTPYYSLEKVWLDFQEGVNVLIRGIDLVSEFALYEYFVDLMGLPRVKHIYMPRLRHAAGELSEVSKTAGNWKIGELRDIGLKPDDVLCHLARSCLINPDGVWSIDNVLDDPTITPELNEIHNSHNKVRYK